MTMMMEKNNKNKELFQYCENLLERERNADLLLLLPNYAHKQFVLEMDEKNGKEMNPKMPMVVILNCSVHTHTHSRSREMAIVE